MSSSAAAAPPADLPAEQAPGQTTTSRPNSSSGHAAAAPVEMSTLSPSAPQSAFATTTTLAGDVSARPSSPVASPTSTEVLPATNGDAPQAPAQDAPRAPLPPADLTRSETEAIGPSTDTPAAKPDNSQGPVVVITLLLTTGARHPYKIDERYLNKRNVVVDDMDPYNISVYTLKELIWRDWREGTDAPTLMHCPEIHHTNITCTEWEPRPSSPSSIRLIHFGRMLDDKSPLKGKLVPAALARHIF